MDDRTIIANLQAALGIELKAGTYDEQDHLIRLDLSNLGHYTIAHRTCTIDTFARVRSEEQPVK